MVWTVEPVLPQQGLDLAPDDRFVPGIVEPLVVVGRAEEAVSDLESRPEVFPIGPDSLVQCGQQMSGGADLVVSVGLTDSAARILAD